LSSINYSSTGVDLVSYQVMAVELFGGAFLGTVFQEATKPFTNQISKAWNFKTTRENLKYLVDPVKKTAEEAKLFNEKLNRSNVEIDSLLDQLKEAEELINKYSNVPWYNVLLLSIYQGELHMLWEGKFLGPLPLLMQLSREGMLKSYFARAEKFLSFLTRKILNRNSMKIDHPLRVLLMFQKIQNSLLGWMRH